MAGVAASSVVSTGLLESHRPHKAPKVGEKHRHHRLEILEETLALADDLVGGVKESPASVRKQTALSSTLWNNQHGVAKHVGFPKFAMIDSAADVKRAEEAALLSGKYYNLPFAHEICERSNAKKEGEAQQTPCLDDHEGSTVDDTITPIAMAKLAVLADEGLANSVQRSTQLLRRTIARLKHSPTPSPPPDSRRTAVDFDTQAAHATERSQPQQVAVPASGSNTPIVRRRALNDCTAQRNVLPLSASTPKEPQLTFPLRPSLLAEHALAHGLRKLSAGVQHEAQLRRKIDFRTVAACDDEVAPVNQPPDVDCRSTSDMRARKVEALDAEVNAPPMDGWWRRRPQPRTLENHTLPQAFPSVFPEAARAKSPTSSTVACSTSGRGNTAPEIVEKGSHSEAKVGAEHASRARENIMVLAADSPLAVSVATPLTAANKAARHAALLEHKLKIKVFFRWRLLVLQATSTTSDRRTFESTGVEHTEALLQRRDEPVTPQSVGASAHGVKVQSFSAAATPPHRSLAVTRAKLTEDMLALLGELTPTLAAKIDAEDDSDDDDDDDDHPVALSSSNGLDEVGGGGHSTCTESGLHGHAQTSFGGNADEDAAPSFAWLSNHIDRTFCSPKIQSHFALSVRSQDGTDSDSWITPTPRPQVARGAQRSPMTMTSCATDIVVTQVPVHRNRNVLSTVAMYESLRSHEWEYSATQRTEFHADGAKSGRGSNLAHALLVVTSSRVHRTFAAWRSLRVAKVHAREKCLKATFVAWVHWKAEQLHMRKAHIAQRELVQKLRDESALQVVQAARLDLSAWDNDLAPPPAQGSEGSTAINTDASRAPSPSTRAPNDIFARLDRDTSRGHCQPSRLRWGGDSSTYPSTLVGQSERRRFEARGWPQSSTVKRVLAVKAFGLLQTVVQRHFFQIWVLRKKTGQLAGHFLRKVYFSAHADNFARRLRGLERDWLKQQRNRPASRRRAKLFAQHTTRPRRKTECAVQNAGTAPSQEWLWRRSMFRTWKRAHAARQAASANEHLQRRMFRRWSRRIASVVHDGAILAPTSMTDASPCKLAARTGSRSGREVRQCNRDVFAVRHECARDTPGPPSGRRHEQHLSYSPLTRNTRVLGVRPVAADTHPFVIQAPLRERQSEACLPRPGRSPVEEGCSRTEPTLGATFVKDINGAAKDQHGQPIAPKHAPTACSDLSGPSLKDLSDTISRRPREPGGTQMASTQLTVVCTDVPSSTCIATGSMRPASPDRPLRSVSLPPRKGSHTPSSVATTTNIAGNTLRARSASCIAISDAPFTPRPALPASNALADRSGSVPETICAPSIELRAQQDGSPALPGTPETAGARILRQEHKRHVEACQLRCAADAALEDVFRQCAEASSQGAVLKRWQYAWHEGQVSPAESVRLHSLLQHRRSSLVARCFWQWKAALPRPIEKRLSWGDSIREPATDFRTEIEQL